jgi:hypothetical protein
MLGIVPYQGNAGTLERVGYSPAPAPQRPSTMWDWYRQMRELEGRKPESTLQAGVNVVRHNAESAALAALLGFIQGEFGTLDIRGVPLDGIGGLVLSALAIQKADDPTGFSSDLRALGQTCTSVYFYRIAERWRAAKKVIDTKGEPVPESMNIHTPKKKAEPAANVLNDPILEAGRRAGL